MIKKCRKFLLISMVFMLIFTTACVKTNSPDVANKDNDVVGKEGSKDESPKEEVIDMGGRTFKFLTEFGGPNPNTEIGELRLKLQEEAEKKYNVKIEWETVPWAEAATRVKTAHLSGESVADFAMIEYYHAYPTMIAKGYLRPVDDLFDFNDPKWSSLLRNKVVGTFEGKRYGFDGCLAPGATTGIYYNRTLFEREGLPDPQELAEKGQWTWDAFLDIAKRATRDLDGDGTIDQWGFVGYSVIFTRNLIYANNGKIVDERDGKYVFTATEDNSIETLRFVYDMWNTHKCAMPNAHGNFDDYQDSQKMFNTGKAAMVSGEVWEGKTRKDMTDEYGFVWYPKGPKATEYTNVITNFDMWYMPANAKYPEVAAKIFDDMQPWDRIQEETRDVVELNFRTEKDVKMALGMKDSLRVLYFGGIGDMGNPVVELKFYEAVKAITNDGEAPESAFEKIKDTCQQFIDDVLNSK